MDGLALLAWNLRRLRTERRISQLRLGKEAEVGRVHVSEIENQRGNPTVVLLDRFATILDVPLSEFFRLPEQGAKRPKVLRGGRPRSKS